MLRIVRQPCSTSVPQQSWWQHTLCLPTKEHIAFTTENGKTLQIYPSSEARLDQLHATGQITMQSHSWTILTLTSWPDFLFWPAFFIKCSITLNTNTLYYVLVKPLPLLSSLLIPQYIHSPKSHNPVSCVILPNPAVAPPWALQV